MEGLYDKTLAERFPNSAVYEHAKLLAAHKPLMSGEERQRRVMKAVMRTFLAHEVALISGGADMERLIEQTCGERYFLRMVEFLMRKDLGIGDAENTAPDIEEFFDIPNLPLSFFQNVE